MSLRSNNHIFNVLANRLVGIDPASVRMLSDRCLIKDFADAEKEGLIIIPEQYRDRGLNQFGTYRKGMVISTGPGDRFIEVGIEECANEAPRVRRKLITNGKDCEGCNGTGKQFNILEYITHDCWLCHGNGQKPVCVPPQCSPGEVVLYERRREAEIFINGDRYVICNAEQAIVAVLED